MLKENEIAKDFTLPRFDGGESNFHRDSQGKTSVLAFYKFSCPVCQFTFPFLEKIFKAYGDEFYFVAIAQDPPDKTESFRKDYRITMPTLMDMNPYQVSRSYGLEVVPSLFLVNPDHKIDYAGEGFSKQDLLNLADTLAEKSGRTQIEVFGNANVPDFKPG
ncbi:MAG: TlpA family protein disulfide reductase [Acidobacteria bacterium]|nr:MAG: TlpA family protein disulfide reductase [Acidobacteriota bacterium]